MVQKSQGQTPVIYEILWKNGINWFLPDFFSPSTVSSWRVDTVVLDTVAGAT